MDVKDIDGTQCKKVYVRQSNYDSFNFNDITKTRFQSRRSVNPQNPVYTGRDDKGNIIEYGVIQGSSPKKLPYRNNPDVFSSMRTDDIKGALTNTRTMGNFHSKTRKDFKNNTNTLDVPGA